jgi:hypothetical protein
LTFNPYLPHPSFCSFTSLGTLLLRFLPARDLLHFSHAPHFFLCAPHFFATCADQ